MRAPHESGRRGSRDASGCTALSSGQAFLNGIALQRQALWETRSCVLVGEKAPRNKLRGPCVVLLLCLCLASSIISAVTGACPHGPGRVEDPRPPFLQRLCPVRWQVCVWDAEGDGGGGVRGSRSLSILHSSSALSKPHGNYHAQTAARGPQTWARSYVPAEVHGSRHCQDPL